MTVYSESNCAGGINTDFSAPDPWTGICHGISPPIHDAGSMWIEPLTMTESGCVSEKHGGPPEDPTTWGTFARACTSNAAATTCPDPGDYCAATAGNPPDGFSQCIYQKGDHPCPSVYPSKHVFFDSVTDLRECSECSCESPKGGVCSAGITLFSSQDCTSLVSFSTVSSTGPQCMGLTAGLELGGKIADPWEYSPGSCKPMGGEPIGSAEPREPSTFCCQE
jgi:hypothetical protein